MDKVDRPVLERRKIALELRPTRAAASACSSSRRSASSSASDTVLAGVDLDGRPRRARRRRRRQRRRQVGAAEDARRRPRRRAKASARRGRRSGSAVSHRTAAPTTRKATPLAARAARGAGLGGRSRLAADEVPVPLRAGAPGADSLSGGERTRLQLLLLMLARPNCLLARRADEPSRHRVRRGARERARGVRRHGVVDLPRPLLPRPDRRPHPRGVGRRSALVRRRLV